MGFFTFFSESSGGGKSKVQFFLRPSSHQEDFCLVVFLLLRLGPVLTVTHVTLFTV